MESVNLSKSYQPLNSQLSDEDRLHFIAQLIVNQIQNDMVANSTPLKGNQ